MKRENTADNKNIRKAIVNKKMKIEMKEIRAASTSNKAIERRSDIFTELIIYTALSISAPDDITLVTSIK
jgi:hypothetical protein